MKTLIVGSGGRLSNELVNKYYLWADFVIAADGGLMHLNDAHLTPHMLLGDFDSLPDEHLQNARSRKIEVVQFSAKKDYTDLELAIEYAIKKSTRQLVILGATGTRLDHTTCNLHLLYRLIKNNISGYIEDDHNRIYMTDKEITIERQPGYSVSILPMFPFAGGVSTKGLAYELNDARLSFGTGLGISNEFSDEQAIISVKEGLVLVFISKD